MLALRGSIVLRAIFALQGFPTSGPGFLWAAGFHAGLAAVLLLYLLFWAKLNLLQTLPLLSVLALVTTAFGSKALADAGAASRQKQE